ncbi:HAMP domain-containing protein [Paenibacillus alvei]|uniref:Signal transduction histidine kinase n=1 Tax=Paenibacillus alvei TaxID=44250 RepID=A0A383RAX2_PAEAL
MYLVSAKPIPDQEVIRGGVIVISSMDMAQASVMMVRQLLLWVGISGFIIAAGCSFMLSRKMSRPLLKMERATRQIAAGQLETRVVSNSHDEIGPLANAINDLAREIYSGIGIQELNSSRISHMN